MGGTADQQEMVDPSSDEQTRKPAYRGKTIMSNYQATLSRESNYHKETSDKQERSLHTYRSLRPHHLEISQTDSFDHTDTQDHDKNTFLRIKKSFDEYEKQLVSAPASLLPLRQKQPSQPLLSPISPLSAEERQPSLSLLHSFVKASSLSSRSPIEASIPIGDGSINRGNKIKPHHPLLPTNDDGHEDNLDKEDPPSTSATMREKAFYDTIQPQFHLLIFLFQILIHLVPPLLFVLSPNPYAQGIRWNQWKAIRFNILNPLYFYVMLISYFFLSQSDVEIVGHSIYIPAMFFVVHRIALGWKYATMSSTEYHRMMSCEDPSMIDSYIYQSELLSGWIQLDDLVLTFELGAASARIGNRLNETYFHISVPVTADASNSAISNEKHHHSAFIAPCGVSEEDSDNYLQLYAWNEFLKGGSSIQSQCTPANSTKTSSSPTSSSISSTPTDSGEQVNNIRREQGSTIDPENTVEATNDVATAIDHGSPFPFPLVKELQPLILNSDTVKLSGGVSTGDIHYVVSVFDVCKTIIRRANNDNNFALYVVAFLVFGTMLLMILLLIIPVLSKVKTIQSSIAMILFIVSSTMLIWDYGRAYFFFLYVSLVDVSRYLKMMQMLHYMIRLTDLVMMKSATFSSSSSSSVSSKPTNSINVNVSKDKTKQFSAVSTLSRRHLFDVVDIENGVQRQEVMSAAEHHMMAIFDLCESGDLRRSIVKRRLSMMMSPNIKNFVNEPNHESSDIVRGMIKTDLQGIDRINHCKTQIHSCSSEDFDLSERAMDSHQRYSSLPNGHVSNIVQSIRECAGELPLRSLSLEPFSSQCCRNHKSIAVIEQYKHMLENWKAPVPRLNLQPLSTLSHNGAFSNSDNVTAWMLTRLAIQHFGDRFRFRTDGYLGKSTNCYDIQLSTYVFILQQLVFTGSLTFCSMVLALIAISDSADRRAAYGSTLFLQAVLSISLFIIMFILVLVIGMSVNVELAAQW